MGRKGGPPNAGRARAVGTMSYPQYTEETNHFCRNCEDHCAIKIIHELEEGEFWEMVKCNCGWSKIVRDDYCPQFLGKETWPARESIQ